MRGFVYDDAGQPLFGAHVLEKGTTNGVVTGTNGEYVIKVASEKSILIFNYVGFEELELEVGSRALLNAVLATQSPPPPRVAPQEQEFVTHAMSDDYAPQTFNAGAYSGGLPQNTGTAKRRAVESGIDWNTEDYSYISENRFYKPGDEPLSTFSIDVDGASYSNLRRFLNFGQKPPADAVRIEEMVNYFNYDYAEPQGDVPFGIFTEVGPCPWNDQHKLVHIGIQGQNIPVEDLPASNLVFLVDVSGSMSATNKLPLVKKSLRLLVGELREKDRVAIIAYAGAAGLVLPSTSGMDKEKILQAIERLESGGSTAGAAGIRLAYQTARENFITNGNNRVILATDGDFNVGVSSDGELVRIIEKERESGVFLSVTGFGTGNYKDNKMQELADHGNGNHSYIDNITEARKVFVNEFGGTLFTIAKDVKIQVEFNPNEVGAYRLIGYENRMLDNEDFEDDRKDAGEIGSGHTVTAIYEIIPFAVHSQFLPDVDRLKYQTEPATVMYLYPDELMSVKIRYKAPDGNVSREVEHTVCNSFTELIETSDNFRWSAAVATFGMILRDSEFKGDASYEMVDRLARGAMGEDKYGYRSEFLGLVRGNRDLAQADVNR